MKFFNYVVLLVISLLWLGGCSQSMLRLLSDTHVIVDDYRYGDLYRLSNLPQFKDPVAPCPTRPVAADSTDIHFYVIGDSFTEPERLSKQDLPVSRFHRTAWDKQDTIQLDPAARNVLLIESVERHFREHAATPIQNLVVAGDSNRTDVPKIASASWGSQLVTAIKGKGMEERLETVLFSHDFFLWFRELKAALTLSAFGRVSPTVSLSANKQQIFIALDTDSTKTLNAGTSPVSDREISGLVATVNETATHYRALGFQQVLLSIIPNKATIQETAQQRNYNHLIERVQENPALQVSVIDTYSLFRQRTQPLYALGDSHLNCTGRQLWLDALTSKISQ